MFSQRGDESLNRGNGTKEEDFNMEVVEPIVSTMGIRVTEKTLLRLGSTVGKRCGEEKMGEQKHFYSKGKDVLIQAQDNPANYMTHVDTIMPSLQTSLMRL